MADYDGVVRIGTKIDTSGFKDGEKELEKEADKLGESLSESTTVKVKIDASEAEKELEKVMDKVGKEESRPYTPGYDAEAMKAIEEILNNQSEAASKVDEHFNLLKIDVEEYSKSLKELQAQGKFFGDEEYDKVYLAWKNATDAVKEYRAELNKKSALGQAKEAELQEAAQRRAEEQAEKALQKENERIQKQIENEAKLQAKEAERQAILQAQEAEEQRLDQIRVNAVATNDQIIEKVERIKELEQEIADLKKAGITEGYSDYDERIQELEKLKKEITEYKKSLSDVPKKFEDMQKSAKKAFNAISEETKKSSGLLSTFASRLKGLLFSLLIFNWISKAFRSMISGMKKGFENFMGYSDSYAQSVQKMKNSMATLGNQFASAFAPVVQTVIPWLKQLIDAIAKAMTYVAQFIALLTGASTFTRAKQIQDSYNKSLGGTAAAAKKAYGVLAKFDDLNVLQKKEDTSGAGGAEATLPKDMFEEVPVDPKIVGWMENLGAIIDIVKEKAVGLKDVFAQGFFGGLGDWEDRWESVKNKIESIKNIILEIISNTKVLKSVWELIKSTIEMVSTVIGAIVSMLLTVITSVTGGIEKFLEQNEEKIKEFIITISNIITEINELISKVAIAIAYVFEAFESEQAQQLIADILGIIFAISGVVEFVYKLFRDLLEIVILPFIENADKLKTALEGLISFLEQILSTIKQGLDNTFAKLNEIYDAHFKPFFNSIATGLSDTTGKFLEFWNSYMQPVLNGMAEKFDTVWAEHIQPALDKFIDLLGKVADFLKIIWEIVLKPLIDWIIEHVLPVIASVSEVIINMFFEGLGALFDFAGGLIDILSGTIDFLIGVFTGDWKTAWNGIVEILNGVLAAIKGIINGIIGSVEAMANGVVDGINYIIRALNNLSFDIPDWVPEYGGKSFGFNLSEIPKVTIPKLASGAVIRGGNPFMAILGDQPAGKVNVEAPLDTIKQAVREELSSMNLGNRESVPLTINLNYDGETFARLSLSDILAEAAREGLNVDVLGVT